MNILLVVPKANDKVILKDKFSMHEPLALEYIAAGVQDNHNVKILDMRLDDNLTQTLEEFQPHIVATTGFTIHIKNCKRIFKEAKSTNPEILTVIGGHHATIKPEDYNEKYIDVIVIGEGVLSFKEIVQKWDKKESFEDIEGIAVIKNGKLIKTAYRPYTDLDLLPFPARQLTQKYRPNYFISSMGQVASIRTSLGCYFRCNYCALWQITKGEYLVRDPESVIKELSMIEEENIFFADDESMLKAKRMLDLADRIKSAGIKKRYRIFGRADTIVRRPDLIEKLCEIGLHSVVVGFEGITDQDLVKLNKGTTVSVNEEAISILKQNGVEVCADFIVTQDYDLDKFKQLSDYVKTLDLKVVIFPILTPLPGTQLYESTKDQIITEDYDLYDFKHSVLPTKLPLDVFYDEFAKLHYLMFSPYRQFIYKNFFPITKYLPTFSQGYEILNSLKNLYRDHGIN
ncbi:MAG: radical SAM protein [Pseudomonadota bacterium]